VPHLSQSPSVRPVDEEGQKRVDGRRGGEKTGGHLAQCQIHQTDLPETHDKLGGHRRTLGQPGDQNFQRHQHAQFSGFVGPVPQPPRGQVWRQTTPAVQVDNVFQATVHRDDVQHQNHGHDREKVDSTPKHCQTQPTHAQGFETVITRRNQRSVVDETDQQ